LPDSSQEPSHPNLQHKANWYTHIDQLVIDYQDNENREKAITKLIQAFQPYLMKYFKLLRDGRINLKDVDSRKFIGMFVANSQIRKALSKSRLTPDAKNAAYQAAHFISANLQYTSSEDIMQELICILLTLANNYLKTRKKLTFAGYVFNAFRYYLYRHLRPYTTDPLTYASNLIIRYNDNEYSEDENAYEDIDPYQESNYLTAPYEDLDINWIYGKTCSSIFSALSPLDRLILRMSYIDGVSDTEIAAKTGFHLNTINKRRNSAIKLIAENAYENNQMHKV